MKQYPVEYVQLSNGETLAYRSCGSGANHLVLIHGNMSSSVHLQPLMERLEPYFTIHAVDMRGFGDSSYDKPFDSLGELALDIREFLEIRKIANPVLLGWSTGGGVVLEVAAQPGADVRAAVLLSSVALKGYPWPRMDSNFKPIEGEYLTTREEIAQDPILGAPALAAYKNQDKEYFRNIYNAAIYSKAQPDPADYDLYLDAILKQRNLLDVDYSLIHFNATDEPSPVEPGSGIANKVSCPVVIIHGEADLVIPQEAAKETKVFFGDQAELHILKGLSHSIMTDDPDTLAKILLAFS